MKFSDLNLAEEILRALDKLGIDTPTAIQEEAIPVAMTGADLIGKSVTGSGKTFAYGLPLIDMLDKEVEAVQSIVICPTRELAEQVAVELRKVTNSCERIKVQLLTGGMDMSKQIKGLKDGVKIVVGTPGRLCDHLRRRTLKMPDVKTVVLDEADEMLSMGFREELTDILTALPKYHTTWMFSATMPSGVREIAEKYMNNPKTVEIGNGVATVSAIKQGYIFCKNSDKTDVLISALSSVDTDKCLVFCNTRKTVEILSDALSDMNFNVHALHGQMQQSQRRRAMSAARSFDGSLLVATDVAARGIDISDIEYVFNYDLPHDLEFYIHRIGRTARAGKQGTAVTIVATRMQQNTLRDFAKQSNSELVAMAVVDGKLQEIGNVKDEFVSKVADAKARGDVGAVRDLEATHVSGEDAGAGTDHMMESMLNMLRRKPKFDSEIAELKNFGFSNDELLSAALGLYVDARQSMERSHADRQRRGSGKTPYRGGGKREFHADNRDRRGDRDERGCKPYKSGGREDGYRGEKRTSGDKEFYGDRGYKSDKGAYADKGFKGAKGGYGKNGGKFHREGKRGK